ncbi:MAG: phosphomannomutase/phosphoglucomutase [Actinomycetota bacterium]|nr:phosphomannomutase/phosphoglucomutase [Actinomycetota bacterium]
MDDTSSLERVFKAYDVRGLVPDDLSPALVREIGAAFAEWSKARKIVVARDCRLTSPQLADAIAEGATSRGVDVVDIGLASSDLMYFASGALDLPGVMVTASHNSKQYNGLKFCLERAKPVSQDTGLADIRMIVEAGSRPSVASLGTVERRNMLEPYVEHVLRFIDASVMRELIVVIDTANGMGGLVAPAVLERLPVKVVSLFPELDGTFPNHRADPMDPTNKRWLRDAVRERHADIGFAFDDDADRVFLVDERAQDVTGSTLTAFIAQAMLRREPGATILYNLICSWAVPEVIRESGGTPVRTRVGHSFIKKIMAETGAVFGGEHSGHFYFRENYHADSGMIASVVSLQLLSQATDPLSELLAPLIRYFDSGEINSEVDDKQERMEDVDRALIGGRRDRLDGLTVEFDDWWCNVRPSNTEPLLRLNVEARTADLLQEKATSVLATLRGAKA